MLTSVMCIKFESGLRLEIKRGVGYLEIHHLPVLLISAGFMIRILEPNLLFIIVIMRIKR